MMKHCMPVAAAVAALSLSGQAAPAAPLKAVVYDLEMVVGPLDPPIPPRQTERLAKMSGELRDLIAKSGQVTLIDTAPEKAAIEKSLPLHTCHDCDLDIARALGTDIEVTTAVQRTSNLIVGFSAAIRDVKTGKMVRSGLVDVRGDTDDLWEHGIKFLVKDRLLDPPLPQGSEALRAVLDK
jgi:hypothetical protein